MPQAPEPRVPRRRFLKTVGLAGLTTTLAPVALSLAQAPTPTAGTAPAAPDSAKAAAPPEISGEARQLAGLLRSRYPHLTEAEAGLIARDFDGDLRLGKRLREAKLENADEPDFTFHA